MGDVVVAVEIMDASPLASAALVGAPLFRGGIIGSRGLVNREGVVERL